MCQERTNRLYPIKVTKTNALIITILAPDGRLNAYDPSTPTMTENTEIIDDITMVDLKLFEIWSAATVGNMIMLEISIVPTTLIPSTMVTDVRVAIK